LNSLENLNGFKNIQFIGSDLWLSELRQLKTLSMPMLEQVGHHLYINELDILPSFESFQRLYYIGRNLEIHNNASLENIESIFNLTTLLGNLKITSNPTLPTLQAQLFADHLLLNQFTGTIIINGNLD